MREGTIASELERAKRELQAALEDHALAKDDAAKATALDGAWSRVTFMTTLHEMVERESERAAHAVERLGEALKRDPSDASARAELAVAKARAELTARLMRP